MTPIENSPFYEKLLAERRPQPPYIDRATPPAVRRARSTVRIVVVPVPTADLDKVSLRTLARYIRSDWENPYFGAVPYIDAMLMLDSIDDDYGADSGESIVRYFLANAATWRGPVARAVKAELKRRVKR